MVEANVMLIGSRWCLVDCREGESVNGGDGMVSTLAPHHHSPKPSDIPKVMQVTSATSTVQSVTPFSPIDLVEKRSSGQLPGLTGRPQLP